MATQEEQQAGWWIAGILSAIGIGAVIYYFTQKPIQFGLPQQQQCCVERLGHYQTEIEATVSRLVELGIITTFAQIQIMDSVRSGSPLSVEGDSFSLSLVPRYSQETNQYVYDFKFCDKQSCQTSLLGQQSLVSPAPTNQNPYV